MYCSECGAQNDDSALTCVQCGNALLQPGSFQAGVPTGARVPSYLAQAILVTLFCCLPFGIVAIVFAAQVNSRQDAGDYAGAVEASNKARMWCWISVGAGLAVALAWFLIAFVGGLAGIDGLAGM